MIFRVLHKYLRLLLSEQTSPICSPSPVDWCSKSFIVCSTMSHRAKEAGGQRLLLLNNQPNSSHQFFILLCLLNPHSSTLLVEVEPSADHNLSIE